MKWKLWAAPALLALPLTAIPRAAAVTCTTQAEMTAQDRDMLSSVAVHLAAAVAQQDYGTLQAGLFPAEASSWNGIRDAAEQAAPLLAGGQLQVRNLYLMDASMQTGTADTQFFCSDSTGELTVTITMRALPPGRYALALAESEGAKLDGHIGIILGWDAANGGWKLAGLSAHQGIFDSHDGVWYWTRGRALAHTDPWSAWYSYDAARYLLIPVSFLSSPNLQKLDQEQAQIQPAPPKAFPLSLQQGDRTWKIDSLNLDPSLHEPDLAMAYESTGVTDPAALRTEATSVMSALLKAQPGLRANFHGLWAYAIRNGNRAPVMELPMSQIP